jgi:glucose-1-phosphate adenylyltransferase
MIDAMGVIYTHESDTVLKDLTQKRSIAAVPIGGRYRMIDFILSNMVNSGIRNIVLIPQSNYESLLEHIGTGKEWDLDRKRDGLFVLTPYAKHDNPGWYSGSIDAFHSSMSYIKRSREKYVILCGSHMICNQSYKDALQYHIEKGADITVIYKQESELSSKELRKYTLIKTDEDGRVIDMEITPPAPRFNKVSMKMYIIDKMLLEYLIAEGVARGCSDIIKDIFLKKLDALKIYGYEHKGYLGRVDSISTYYENNMNLLNSEIRDELFTKNGPIYTRIRDEVPAKYDENAKTKNCLVADGCIVEGEVENSILSRGVKIYKGAQVKNCIIMEDTEIHENVKLEHAIIDKGVVIKRGRRLIGQESYPIVVAKGEII